MLMPSSSNGSGASPVPPAQPIQVPPCWVSTGCSAVTRPPGLVRHWRSPSGEVTSSTGRRLATTTKELRSATLSAPPGRFCSHPRAYCAWTGVAAGCHPGPVTPPDDLSPPRRPIFFPVVIATVFLTIIGGTAGFMLGERHRDDGAAPRETTTTDEAGQPSLAAPSGPPCPDEAI